MNYITHCFFCKHFYKKILIKGKNYQGYFLVIYNPTLLNFSTIETEVEEENIIVEDKEVLKNILTMKENKLITTENYENTDYVEYKIIQNKTRPRPEVFFIFHKIFLSNHMKFKFLRIFMC